MPLLLQPAVPTDVPQLVEVWDVSFKDSSPLDGVIFPRTPSVRDWYRSSYLSDFSDPSARFLKIVDTDTIDPTTSQPLLAAYAKWYVPVPLPDEPQKRTTVGGAGPEDIAAAEWPEEYPARICREVFGEMAEARRKVFGRPLRAHYYLERVGVRREYRGSGSGRRLIEWGLERADEEGLEAYIEAHDGVVELYERFGWRTVGRYRNEEIGHTETFMVRPAKGEKA